MHAIGYKAALLQDGQAEVTVRRNRLLVECAVTAPAALMLMLGVVQIGAILRTHDAMQSVLAAAGDRASTHFVSDGQLKSAMMATVADGYSILKPRYITNIDAITDPMTTRADVKKIDMTIGYGVPSWAPFLPQVELFEMEAKKSVYVKTS